MLLLTYRLDSEFLEPDMKFIYGDDATVSCLKRRIQNEVKRLFAKSRVVWTPIRFLGRSRDHRQSKGDSKMEPKIMCTGLWVPDPPRQGLGLSE